MAISRGELTARTRLVVHGTGRVSGTIRYGRLIVADGGDDQRRRAGSSMPRSLPPRRAAPPRRGASEARARSYASPLATRVSSP